jgi:hypothetical protein
VGNPHSGGDNVKKQDFKKTIYVVVSDPGQADDQNILSGTIYELTKTATESDCPAGTDKKVKIRDGAQDRVFCFMGTFKIGDQVVAAGNLTAAQIDSLYKDFAGEKPGPNNPGKERARLTQENSSLNNNLSLGILPPSGFFLTGLGCSDDLAGGSVSHVGAICDVNGDGKIDINDINLIMEARDTPAGSLNDPRDADRDGTITANDARICVLRCTNARCVP